MTEITKKIILKVRQIILSGKTVFYPSRETIKVLKLSFTFVQSFRFSRFYELPNFSCEYSSKIYLYKANLSFFGLYMISIRATHVFQVEICEYIDSITSLVSAARLKSGLFIMISRYRPGRLTKILDYRRVFTT